MRTALVLVGAVLTVLLATPAHAHSGIASSNPAANSTITTAPDEITLTFAGAIRGNFSTVVVTGPDGATYGDGKPRAIDRTLHQPVKPLVSGRYTVAWRIVAGDGHPLQGVFTFTADLPVAEPTPSATSAAPPATTPEPSRAAAPSDDEDGGNGLLLAAAGVGALVVIVGIVALARRRRTP
ncbi:copper resistance CopC family protein [Cryptosporangium minutisporangium]|uniref:Copper resistance protein CopC n=1 Tax=Cryptosporangium minutisporangium TaxID=113569 RepID=A0ABP6SYG1_9ACTN